METINISTSQDTQYDFNLTATGLDIKSGKVFFCIKQDNDLSIQIRCKHLTGQQWLVKFPKGAFEFGEHDFDLCVVVNDFYFEPMSGKLNVVSSGSVSVNNKEDKPKENTEDKSKQKDQQKQTDKSEKSKKDIPKKEIKEDTAETVKEQSSKTTQSTDYQFFTTDHPYGKLPDRGEKDRKVREILNSFKK